MALWAPHWLYRLLPSNGCLIAPCSQGALLCSRSWSTACPPFSWRMLPCTPVCLHQDLSSHVVVDLPLCTIYSACHGYGIGSLLHIRSEVSPCFIPHHQTKPSPCPWLVPSNSHGSKGDLKLPKISLLCSTLSVKEIFFLTPIVIH